MSVTTLDPHGLAHYGGVWPCARCWLETEQRSVEPLVEDHMTSRSPDSGANSGGDDDYERFFEYMQRTAIRDWPIDLAE